MNIQRVVVSSRQLLLSTLLVSCLVAAFASAGIASDQKEKIVRRSEGKNGQAVLEIGEYTFIPEATEACTPEVSAWWKEVRKAGNEIIKRRDEGSKKRFYLLLYEGQQKAYRVPLKDRSTLTLVRGHARYLEAARRSRLEGEVELSAELKADGSVGDVQVVKELGMGLDEEAVRAAQQTIFLPAIKDGSFVSDRTKIIIGFDLPGGSYKPSYK